MSWTAKAVEHRVLEAAETLMLTPNTYVGCGNAWPEYIPHYPRQMRIRVRPSPGALTRMAETWGWINAHPVESDRRLLYAWAWQKTKRGRFLNDFAAREGINSRTLRRQITRICQDIADRLMQAGIACLDRVVDDVSEMEPETPSETVPSQRYANHMMAPGAKPRYPTPEEIEALERRIMKANRRRRRQAKRA